MNQLYSNCSYKIAQKKNPYIVDKEPWKQNWKK